MSPITSDADAGTAEEAVDRVDRDTVMSYREAPQRQARLLGHLRSQVFVDIQALTDVFGVSVSTIRRDLAELERQGLLRRTHGGAVVVNQVTRDAEAAVREMTNVEEKSRIGAAAAALVTDGDTVMIDSGTTSLQVARRLAGNPTLTFVTNGTDVLAALVAGGAGKVHCIGGQFVGINHSLGGTMAADMVRRFNVDKAILSVTSVDTRRDLICTLSPEIGCVQQAMIEVAQTVVVVADHSKFGRTALSVIAPLDDVDYIVTDAGTRPLVASVSDKLKKKIVFA
jgi:DeoR/GlpR family transcriptional regulator of sugar metabolism